MNGFPGPTKNAICSEDIYRAVYAQKDIRGLSEQPSESDGVL